MNLKVGCNRSAIGTALGFLGLLTLIALFSVAKGRAVIEATLASRAIGLLIGAMIVMVSNLVPKLRPLNAPASDPAEAGAAERSAGWTLVLIGITYIALFAFAPLELATRISTFVGMGGVAVIAINWTWLARGTLFGGVGLGEPMIELSEQTLEKRKMIISLLFGLLFVLAEPGLCFWFPTNRRAGSSGPG